MPLDTDFIRFSREMKPTKQCKISQKNYGRTRGGGRTTAPPLNTPLEGGLFEPPSHPQTSSESQSLTFPLQPICHLTGTFGKDQFGGLKDIVR